MTVEQFIQIALIGNKSIMIYAFTGFMIIKSLNQFKKLALNNFVYQGKEYKVEKGEIKPC